MASMRRSNMSGVVKGTTAASYVKVLTVDTRGMGILGKTRFLLKNTMGAVAPMFYKIDGYLWDTSGGDGGGLAIALRAETSVAHGVTVDDSTFIVQGYAAVVISVKTDSSTGGGPSPADFQIDWSTF